MNVRIAHIILPLMFCLPQSSFAEGSNQIPDLPILDELIWRSVVDRCPAESAVYGEIVDPAELLADARQHVAGSAAFAMNFAAPMLSTDDVRIMSFLIVYSEMMIDQFAFMQMTNADHSLEGAAFLQEEARLRIRAEASHQLGECMYFDDDEIVQLADGRFAGELQSVLENDRCVNFLSMTRRFLDIPMADLNKGEREEAGIRAIAEHNDDLMQSGIAAECEKKT